MSVFLNIVRFEHRDPDSGQRLPITEAHLEGAVAKQPLFRLLRQGDAIGVKVLSNAVVVFNGETLECHLQHNTDVDLLTAVLCELAAVIPDAVVRDEDGNTLYATA